MTPSAAGPAPEHAPAARVPQARLVVLATLIALLGVGLCAWLNHFKFESALEAAARSRLSIPAGAVRSGLQSTLALGLPLASAAAVPELLARARHTDDAILEIVVFEPSGRVLFATDAQRIGTEVAPAWRDRARTDTAPWQLREPGSAVLGLALHNSFELTLGQVALVYALDREQQALTRMDAWLRGVAVGGWLATSALAGLGLWGVARWRGRPRIDPVAAAGVSPASAPTARLRTRLAAAMLLALLLGLLGVSALTQDQVATSLRPHLLRQAEAVGRSVAELVAKARDHGLALTELVGVAAVLDGLRREHPQLAHLALHGPADGLLAESGRRGGAASVSVPVPGPAPADGRVEVGVSAGYIQAILRETALDVLVVFVVVAFLTRELLAFVLATDRRLAGTVPPVDTALARLRLPLLLFMLAEELTRTFLPGHAAALVGSATALPADIAIGLPIAVFMLVVALGQPVLAVWSERVGTRRALQIGALTAALGLAGSALAASLPAFVAWRALGGLGYAMVFVAGQGFVIAGTRASERPRGFAQFVGAIIVAGVCGPPLGGIVADHLGARWGFALAALLALVACLAVRALPVPAAPDAAGGPDAPATTGRLGGRDLLRVLRQPRFLGITLLAAVPAKVILVSFCFYLVPIHVLALGAPTSVAGRALMVYAVALLAVQPWATRLAERGVPQARLVGGGLCLSTLGGFALLAADGLAPVFAATLLLGAGQGLAIAAQSSLLSLACADEIRRHGSGALFGSYRLIERLGNAAAPLLAGALVAWVGLRGSFGLIAALVLACGVLFLALARRQGLGQVTAAEATA